MPQDEHPEDPGPDYVYCEKLDEGKIILQKCDSCDEFFFPPRVMCPKCKSLSYSWQEASGAGRIYSTSVVRRRPEKGGNYSIVLVDLDDGVRMMSTVTNVAPEAVKIGQAVTVNVSRLGDEDAVTLSVVQNGGSK
jgi:hypothetical protein